MARPTALGAYIFAGGFTVGVARVFNVLAHLEETNYGVATVNHNFPKLPVHYGVDRWPGEFPAIDFLYGNPPCAAWSVAGSSVVQGTDWRADPRVDCTRRLFGLLRDHRPKFWAWESVVPAFTMGRPFVDELTRDALNFGYSVTYLLHNSMYLGVPQKRLRFFFVAHQMTFDIQPLIWVWQSSLEALRGLNDPGIPLDNNIKKYAALLPRVKPGEQLRTAWYREHPEPRVKNIRGQNYGCPPLSIKRIKPDQPSNVIMHEIIHPTEHRALSIKELSALCGYPPDYEFINARDAGQIGRGVCPPVGEWLARNVARCLKRGATDPEPIVQLIDVREPPGSTTRLPYPEEDLMPRTVSTASPPPRTPPGGSIAPPAAGLGSGAYIRSLLVQGHAGDAILAAVHAHYPGSKATKSDIAWNRGRLRKEGTEVAKGNGSVATPANTATVLAKADRAPPWADAPQPSRKRQNINPHRKFDTTSLRASSHGKWVHRDYGAHFFRWGFAGRFVDQGKTDILDVGCGVDVPMIDVLTMPMNQVPRSYVGVDFNNPPQKPPTRTWATLHWNFDFTKNFKKLGQFDLITNFEVIEHMSTEDGLKLLKGLKACLRPTGKLLLSTPVFNGKAAANHLHEYTIEELHQTIKRAGLRVVKRFGTFASQKDLKKAASPAELELVKRLGEYYSGEVLSCFLAPLYPDASRNNVWLIDKGE